MSELVDQTTSTSSTTTTREAVTTTYQQQTIMNTSSSLIDENQMLQQELNKVEDLLSTARAERDEIIIKYNALSDRVSLKIKFIFIN
jgi:hypothetical protein